MAEPSAPAPVPPTITPQRRGGGARGCLGDSLRGLLIVLLSVALSVAAAGAVAYGYFGYTPEAPGRIQVLQTEVVAAQLELQAQGQRAAVLQTAVADVSAREGASREAMQELEAQVADLQALGQQMQENNALAATVQSEARDSRTAVALFSTAQAARAAQLDELQRRAERISRFLARLGDISSDAATDLEPQGTALSLPTIEPATAEPTSTLATPTSTAAPTDAPTASTATAASTASPTGTAAPTGTTVVTRTVTATP
jgi:hypothetical protein